MNIIIAPLVALLGRQPDYQPFNLAELAATFARPPEFRGLWQKVLEPLAEPERGLEPLLEILLDQTMPYDLYLMLAAERALIVLGIRDPIGVLAAVERIHREGCQWFRQADCTFFPISSRKDRI